MTDYTKGEWQRIRSGNDYAVAAKSEKFYPDDSLHMRGVARGIGNCDDARLIAAAPDMYEALKELFNAWINNDMDKMRDGFDFAARKALAKVNGQW